MKYAVLYISKEGYVECLDETFNSITQARDAMEKEIEKDVADHRTDYKYAVAEIKQMFRVKTVTETIKIS